jgi:hypothetical protein
VAGATISPCSVLGADFRHHFIPERTGPDFIDYGDRKGSSVFPASFIALGNSGTDVQMRS